MYASALRASTASPGWDELRQAVMRATCACAAGCADPGPCAAALRDLAGLLRPLAFDEAVIEAEAARRAAEIIAAAGLTPPPPQRHLRAVT